MHSHFCDEYLMKSNLILPSILKTNENQQKAEMLHCSCKGLELRRDQKEI